MTTDLAGQLMAHALSDYRYEEGNDYSWTCRCGKKGMIKADISGARRFEEWAKHVRDQITDGQQR